MERSDVPASALPAMDVFDPAPVAVALFRGPEHTLAYTNENFRQLFGHRPLGTAARETLGDLAPPDRFGFLDRVYADGQPVIVGPDRPVRLTDAHGRTRDRWFTASFSLITGQGRPGGPEDRGVLLIAMELTGEVAARGEAHALSEMRLRALHRYESLIAAGTQKVWVSDRDGKLIERSPDWERVTGMSWDELRGDGWLDSAHPLDRPALAEAWAQAVREPPELFRHVYRLRHKSGEYRHAELRAVPIREHDRVVEWVGACSDVEDRWQQDRRSELLAQAVAAVSGSDRVDRAFGSLGSVIVPDLADACGVYVFPEAMHPQAGQPLLINRISFTLREGLPPAPAPLHSEHVEPGSAFDRVIRERRPVHTKLGTEALLQRDVPPGAASWARAADAHDIVMFPVRIGESVEAVFAVYACGGRPALSSPELSLVRAVLDQSTPALAQVLELRRTRRISLALQSSLLSEPPQPAGMQIVARYLPSFMADEVGGDWYDSFTLPDGATTLIIGDVAGHDLHATVVMSKMRHKLRALAVDRGEPPGDILRRLDLVTETLDPEESTATCIYARVEGPEGGPWELYYSIAGHPPPLLVTADGTARFLGEAQDVLLGGLAPDLERSSSREPLPPGCTVFLYTDGLVERPDEPLDRGLERLRRQAAELATEPLGVFCQELLDEPAATSSDDIAVIALRLPGRPAPA